jgi:dTMP kinase
MIPAPKRFHPGSRRGAFITLEGGEGAGKSTQIDRIVDNLARAGIKAIATREPGGSPRSEILRKVLLSGVLKPLGPAAEAIAFAAARIDHIDATIEPALAVGTFVVCDRFADSTRAYQGAAGGLDEPFIRALESVTLGSLRPDLTLILDIPPREGLSRVVRRTERKALDRFETENLRFHETLREAFLDIASREPIRCVVIDAAQSEDIVERAIWAVIVERLLQPLITLRAHGS